MAAVSFVLVGMAMIAVGVSAWFGWYRSWARGPLGNMYVPLAPMGVGVALVGVAGMTGAYWLGIPSVLIALSGILLYTLSPVWLEPRWYQELKKSHERRTRSDF